MTKIQRFLFALSIVILGSIITATCIFFILGIANPGDNLRKKEKVPPTLETSTQKMFTDLGTLRCVTNDDLPISIVVSPYFAYPSKDSPYFEELKSKNRKIQLLITSYFALFTMDELKTQGEAKIKSELVQLCNQELILGQIDQLYFSEYIFLE